MKAAEHDNDWSVDANEPDSHLALALSAFMDGEQSLVDIDIESDQARQHWSMYHLIGDAMREPSALPPVTAEFSSRVAAALARETPHGQSRFESQPQPQPQPQPVRESTSRWRQAVLAWPGLAVAAAVASVVWIAQPLFGVEREAETAMSVAKTEPVGNAALALDRVRPESDYVSAHRQMAGPIAVRQVAFTPGAD